MSVNLLSSGGGSAAIVAPNTANNYTATLPANNGTIITTGTTFSGNGPAFRATDTATTATAGVATLIAFDTTEFDTASAWDGSKFQPLVAGYYQINATVTNGVNTNIGSVALAIYKNGASYLISTAYYGAANVIRPSTSTLVYLNGSTDYIQIYGTNIGNANLGIASVSGCLVRDA